jgi:hypothetical protein
MTCFTRHEYSELEVDGRKTISPKGCRVGRGICGRRKFLPSPDPRYQVNIFGINVNEKYLGLLCRRMSGRAGKQLCGMVFW